MANFLSGAEPSRDSDTERRILEAAHAVFMRRGTAGARMQEIAAEAGVNQALLHYYFRSKARLAEAVFRSVAVRIFPPLIEVLAADLDIDEKVRRVVELELDFLSRSPFVPAYVISEINQHPERVLQFVRAASGVDVGGMAPRVLEILRAQLESGARTGALRPIGAEEFVVNLLSLCIFPFAARPMMAAALHMDDRAFHAFIERRRRELPEFIMSALRP